MLHHHIRGSITKHHLLFFDTYLDKKYIKIASIWTLVRNIFWRYNIFTNEKYLTLHYWWKNPWSIICFLEIHRFTSSLYPSLLHLSNWVSCSCRQQQYFTCCYRLEVYHPSCLFTYFALWIKAILVRRSINYGYLIFEDFKYLMKYKNCYWFNGEDLAQ